MHVKLRLSKYCLASAITLVMMLGSVTVYAESILWKETTIPMPEAGKQGLETLLVWPNTPGKHPLILLSHGSPRNPADRPKLSAISYLPIAMEFARRGFTVAVVIRRGYGHSGGGWVEGYNNCEAANYQIAATQSSKDLHAALHYLATLPQVDADHIIAVGVSAGGFASIALSADSPPKGLEAVISFAGVRGSKSNDQICHLDSLVASFGEFGKTSRVPMLWIYADNDHFANPAIAQQLLTAFQSNGGKVTFIKAPPYGTEGHFLFSAKGIPLWTPLVDNFLKQQNLAELTALLPLPVTPTLNPPAQLKKKNMQGFTDFLQGPPHKAFAIDANGAFGWVTGKYSMAEAKARALETCQHYSSSGCAIYAVDDKLVSH